ncbi:MAG: WG repeat-containing protein [Comamonas sp.]|jgi:tripartite-type tricarboxylate transporter receptor subunit TctC|uniref:tripartite tricarboxylate transporter substrate-binding protein n=1 Tax=Comamonas sp. TaxID=34028 RepID=UPI0028370442|nr:tripartite tricarboxylate transporter substrate-binding protein [Comamonas sp.]MDR0215805.1 WG repeat-containing protein [Comamonas sp.]
MKRQFVFSALLWLGSTLCSVHAAQPSYQDLYNHPERDLPMQPTWQLQPVGPQAPRWEDIFAFEIGISPKLIERLRWLSLNPSQKSDLTPALFNTDDGRMLTLSPAARSFCDGRWKVVRVDSISLNPEYQPMFKVWLVEQVPGGRKRSNVGFGRLDAQGHWAVPPKSCDGKDTFSVESSDALLYLHPQGFTAPASDLWVDKLYTQPGLRDAQGRWLTSAPQKELTTAHWLAYRRILIPPGSTGTGLIDVRGKMVVPFVFGNLPDATAQRRIRLCIAAEFDTRRRTVTRFDCRWQKLKGGDGSAAPRLVQDTGTGKWGYQDAQGQWVIVPQFLEARPFRNGYAVVNGLFPEDWRPPGWQEDWPVIRQFYRMGRYWVAEAVVRNGSTDGQWVIRYGLLNDSGQWLTPVREAPLHITVPFPPGGRSSHYAGMLAANLPNLLGRSVQVDHVPEATEADYRRLAMEGGNSTVLLAALRLPRGGIEGVHQGQPLNDLLQSLRPVTLVASQPMVLAIDSARADELGIHNMDELLAYARAHPGSLRIGTGADGGTGHLAFGQFQALSGVDVQRVVYPGMYPDSDVITKEHAVDLLFAPVNGVAVAVRRGQLRVLGTTAAPAHPQSFEGEQWPTLASSAALADYTVYDHFSLWAPADSDVASDRRLQEAVAQVLARPEVQKHLQELQVVGGGGSPESLLKLEEKERAGWMRALAH